MSRFRTTTPDRSLPPILDMSLEGDAMAIAINLAYPVGDVLLLCLLIAAFGVLDWRPGRTWLLLGSGLILSGVADMIYLFQVAEGHYDEHGWISSLWVRLPTWFRSPARIGFS